MITSALISQCRREFGDVPKTVQASRKGNGSVNIFNTGRFPIIENSYSVYVSGAAKTETTDFALDKDSGDLTLVSTPSNGTEVLVQHKYANWRDQNWNEVFNAGISELNSRGFFRQTIRSPIYLSAGTRTFDAPTNAIDAYELLYAPTSGSVSRLPFNWSYQQDQNKFVLGTAPTSKLSGFTSYLRTLQTYSATSATLDVSTDWVELVKMYAGHRFYSFMAGKIAKQGNASIQEGHFSFSNLRAMSRDMHNDFDIAARRKKPTRPAKDIQYNVPGSGVA